MKQYIAGQSNDEGLCILLWYDIQNILLNETAKHKQYVLYASIFKMENQRLNKIKHNDYVLKEMVKGEQG